MPASPQPAEPLFTVGVEEEYQIVDPATGGLRPRNRHLLGEVEAGMDDVGGGAAVELYQSQIEIGTAICPTLGDVRRQVVASRKVVIDAAARDGDAIAAAGTHPFSTWQEQAITPKDRYMGLWRTFRQLASEHVAFGCHVHVGIGEPEAILAVSNRARAWVPTITALAANSPFWQGRDTGYASYRTELWRRWPMSGAAPHFDGRGDFDRLVGRLVETGTINDASNLYWDLRPADKFGTLEFRSTDIAMTVDEAVMIAGLCKGVSRACHEAQVAGEPFDRPDDAVLRAAEWRAARDGVSADLVDAGRAERVPAKVAVERLLSFVRPALEASGEFDDVADLVHRTLDRGTGADRQRKAFAERGKIEDVVAYVVGQTAEGV